MGIFVTDLCYRQPCNIIKQAISGTCQQYGIFDFSCSCTEGYQWNIEKHYCFPSNSFL